MKVPIEVEDETREPEEAQAAAEPVEPDEVETANADEGANAVEADAPAETEDASGAEAEDAGDETDEDAEERARVEAAIRAGEEAAERELAADANKIRAERDELQKKLSEVEDQIEAAKKEAADATERMMRLQADWENYRRRTAAERVAEKERAAEKLVCNLLPVLDDMERAIDHARTQEMDDAFSQFVDGVEAVHSKMLDVFAHEGVEAIDPKGKAFNPLEHQAVGRVEDSSQYDETVNDVYQKGYRMADRILRSAMVTVTYGGEKRPAPEPDAGSNEPAGDEPPEAASAEEASEETQE